MRLLYVTHARIPTEKANGIQIVKMCEAFQQLGIEVELWVPTRKQVSVMKQVQDIWTHYDVEVPFQLHYVLAPDFLVFESILPRGLLKILHYVQNVLFALSALFRTFRRQNSVYYTRSLPVLFVLTLTKSVHRKKIYFEAHELHGDPKCSDAFRKIVSYFISWMLHHSDGLIVITKQLQTLYQQFGFQEQQILLAPDGIAQKRLHLSFDKAAARKKLGIGHTQKIICYTGHLFRWKGVYTLAESSNYLSNEFLVYIVGGMQADIEALQDFIVDKNIKNLVLTGYIPYNQVVQYLQAADLFVLPNSAIAKISREYTSPLKLFEYMAARRPIVASDLPSLREILRHKENAYLVAPDDPQALAESILYVMREHRLAEKMVATAYNEVQNYAWEKRAQKIQAFLQN